MDNQGTRASSSLQGSLWSSDASTPPPSTLYEPIGSQQTHLNEDFEQLATYLVKEKAPKGLYNALKRIYNAYKRYIEPTKTSIAIHTL